MATTIGNYNVSLGLNVADLVDGSKLARNETAAVVRSLKSLTTPAESVSRSLDQMDKALREGAIDARVHAEAVGRIAAKHIQAAGGANTLRQALRQADAMLKQGTLDANAHARAVDHLKTSYAGVQATKGIGGSVGGSLTGLAAGYLSVHSAANFATNAIRRAADVEKAAASYKVLTGSVAEAQNIMAAVQSLASKGIDPSALHQAASTMLSFNVASQDVIPALQRMAEITGGDSERLQRLALAFAQVAGNGRLMGEEVNQMVEAGFNPLQEISRTTGISVADLRKQMEAGLISFDMVKQAFESVTSEGGRFNGMLDSTSDTTGRAMAKISADFRAFEVQVGDALSPLVKMVAEDFAGASGSATDFAGSVSSISLAVAGLSEELKSITGQSLTDFLAKFNGVALTLKGFSLPVDLMRSIGLTSGSVGIDEASTKLRMEASQRVRQSLGDSMFSPEAIKVIDEYFAKADQATAAAKAASAQTAEAQTLDPAKVAQTYDRLQASIKAAQTSAVPALDNLQKQVAEQERYQLAESTSSKFSKMSRAEKEAAIHSAEFTGGLSEKVSQDMEARLKAASDQDLARWAVKIATRDRDLENRDQNGKFLVDAKRQMQELVREPAKEELDRQEQVQRAAQSIAERSKTQTERLAEQVAELNRLEKAGLSPDLAAKERSRLAAESVKDVKIEQPSSMTVGSQEAYKFITGIQNDKDSALIKKAEEQRLLAQAQVDALKITNQKLDKLAEVSPRRAS